ncbi:uroporphyrinogen-III C-methyltransferase [Snodgrassella sp. ESL0253]|uniref:uroporphyrinogen-III C-methyltransferase n=1 Tax=Snodgrassella sp. ESL0253 TaxID=2705031 RepID=UPI0015816A1C|nr:uroporphyrinogen-III C-methyltransferase [Snodgrassella sp. ESL0253]NUE65714.1 heme biosynthesis operon protein HemX [Snodgrassella sp. ESL0253]
MSEQQDAQSSQLPEQGKQPLLVNKQGEVSAPPESATSAAAESTGKDKDTAHQTTDFQKNNTGSGMSAPNVPSQSTSVKQQHSGSGKGIALGALVLSLLALGASGFLFVEGQNQLKTQQLQFDHKIDNAGIDASKTAATVETGLARIDGLSRQLQELQSQQKTQGENVDRLTRAYQELVKSRTDWLVDEIEATLNLASQQLLISGNVPVAVNVLENLDNRLSRFDQPQLLPIKKAISSDLENLKNRPYLDTASASLRLNRLESAVAGLPLVVDGQLKPGTAPATATINPNASWWQRTWQTTMHSLRGMVEVRHINHNDSMLMSPEQIYFVRENLRLRLLDARIALIQRRGEVYVADLNGAEATVKQYFDGSSVATQSWLKELVQLKMLNVQTNQDSNLSASLAAVREYQNQSGMDMSTALPDLSASAASSASAPAALHSERPVSLENSNNVSAASSEQGEHTL